MSVEELTVDEIQQLKTDYLSAAVRCKKAGFDGIELHCTHGYMLASFLSGRSNKRADEYGGTLEGRLRLPLEIIEGLRFNLGRDYPIIARLAAHEENGGRTLEEGRVIARALTEAGLDALDISSGSYSELDWEIPPSYFGFAMNMENIERIKKSINVPVLASGRITEPRLAEQLLDEKRCDMVGINRAGIADPEFAKKAGGGKTHLIRRCIGCVRCIDSVFNGEIRCSVNPHAGREGTLAISPASLKKKVLIVGGGPAGLESAIVCAKRGHNVTVVEKRGKVGGQIISASVPPHKYEIASVITTQMHELRELGIRVITGIEVDANFVRDFDPDMVVAATGAEHIIPDIPGIRRETVATAVEILEGRYHAGTNIAIIGGNMIGCETAEFLAEYGKNVTLFEMTNEIGIDLAVVPKPRMLNRLLKLGVDMRKNAMVTEINENNVKFEQDGKILTLDHVDTVVIAVGMKKNDSLVKLLITEGIPCYTVGDAGNVARLMQALESAYQILQEI